MKIKDEALEALNILNDAGYEAYIVGGAVRDYLLGRPNSDYDITTNAYPNAIKMLFDRYTVYDIGKKHGTVAVHINHLPIEITPYRKEGQYNDHRHPKEVSFTNELQEDLKRRDFTINALAMDKDLKIVDCFGGIDDLNGRLIRAVGNPDDRFHEDALRMLRALRFKVKLNFEIEKETRNAIFENSHLLSFISHERKKDELLQILSFKDAFSLINEYLDVFKVFMPFEKTDRENDFSNPYYALAYLLKDVNRISLKELKYSKDEIDLIRTLISASFIDIDDDYSFISTLSDFHRIDILKYLEELTRRDLSERYRQLEEYMVEANELSVNGNDIETFGYKGNQIRIVKQHLLDAIHSKSLTNDMQTLIDYLKENVVI